MRYIELNPVRAGLAEGPGDWPWSSGHAHLTGEGYPLIGDVWTMIDYIGDWEHYLVLDVEEAGRQRLRLHSRTGRPLGDTQFVEALEQRLGRFLRKRKPAPKGSQDRKIRYCVPGITNYTVF